MHPTLLPGLPPSIAGADCKVFALPSIIVNDNYLAADVDGQANAFCALKGFAAAGNTMVYQAKVDGAPTLFANGKLHCITGCTIFQYVECIRGAAAPGCGESYTPCWNVGEGNDGCNNFGNYNHGDGNVGDFNVGNYNIGNNNTGDGNIGLLSVGSGNQGIANQGDGNIGVLNTGQG